MSKIAVLALSALAVSSAVPTASAEFVTTYTDSTHELFDNAFGNLDIESVSWTQVDIGTGWNMKLSITTRDWADWTKFMVFFNNPNSGGLSSNPWNRPIDLNGQVANTFIGAWVDGGGGNQNWHADLDDASWLLNSTSLTQTIDAANRTLTINLGFAPYAAVGASILFDVATSGGGNDPGVDHLSRSDMATSGWGTASVAGNFLKFTVLPSPGAIALLGLAGLTARRRR